MEIIDVYDKNGNNLGKTAVRGTAPEEGEYYLVVHVCVMNSRGEMLLQQRQITKDRYPGCWDVSAGGFAKSGETSMQAALRELREELGVSADASALSFAIREPFLYVLDDFYICRADLDVSTLVLQPEELMGAKWASEEDVLTMRATGELVDYDERLIRDVFAAFNSKK